MGEQCTLLHAIPVFSPSSFKYITRLRLAYPLGVEVTESSANKQHFLSTQYPFPSRSLVRDGKASQHRPLLVVSHSTCPPLSTLPTRAALMINRSCSTKQQQPFSLLRRSPIPSPFHSPPFTQIPFPPRSLVRDGQTRPHKPRLVVSHGTCPPLSPSPHVNSFVVGPAEIYNNADAASLAQKLELNDRDDDRCMRTPRIGRERAR